MERHFYIYNGVKVNAKYYIKKVLKLFLKKNVFWGLKRKIIAEKSTQYKGIKAIEKLTNLEEVTVI